MKSVLAKAVTTVLLATASVSAFALTITPPTTGPTPQPSTGNGGVDVQVWDPTLSISLVEYLGVNFNDFTVTSTDASTTIDFGTLSGYSTLFASSISAKDTINFNVSAGNFLTSGSFAMLTTSAAGSPTATNPAVQGALQQLETAIGSVQNAAATSANTTCNSGVNPCTASSVSAPGFAWVSDVGATYGGNLTGVTAGTAGGTGVNMYQITQNGTSARTNATVATLAGVWALSSTGDLTYTVSAVPLPAAIWLLGSGILGLAGVARRRSSALAATAA